MPKVIVYTCAYNAEQTLSRAIESVLSQTFTDFAYYIVNNGSTDSTGDIISSYCALDKRIWKVSLLQNDIKHYGTIWHTLSFACKDSADWITILDADDSWPEDYLEKMIRFGDKNELDLVFSGWEQIDSRTGHSIRRKSVEKNIVIHREDYTSNFVTYRGYALTLWGMLYKLRVISQDLCQYNAATEILTMYGDVKAILKRIASSEKIGICSDAIYNWYIHDHSYMLTNFDELFEKYDNPYYFGKNHLESLAPDKPISNFNQNFLYAIYLTELKNIVDVIVNSKHSQPRKLVYIKRVLKNPLTYETFAFKEVHPQINNMVNREKTLDSIIDTVKSMRIERQYQVLFNDIMTTYHSILEVASNGNI